MADRNGYIGRAPSDSAVQVARQDFTPTGVQTNFTFDAGYTPGYLDVYLNGSKLVVAQDFTATDGSVVGLTSAAASGDIIELVAFKAFNAASVNNAGTLTVSGNQTNNGTLSVTGGTTLSNLNVTGISTLGTVSSLDLNGGVLTLDADGDTTITADTDDQIDIAFGGNDRLTLSTGLIDLKNDGSQSAIRLYCESSNAHYAALQAPAHSDFSGNITLTLPATTDTLVARTTTDTLTNKTLTSPTISTPTLTGGVGIADSIFHTGDTNTQLRFPAADTFTVETGGSERVRVGAAGSVGIGTDDPESALHVVGNIPNAPMNFGVHIGAHSGYGIMQFTAATGGIIDFGESGVDSVGRIIYTHSNDALAFQTGNSEALRIDSSGRLLIGETSAVLDTSNALLQIGASEGANMVLYRDDSSVAQNDSIGLIRFYSNAGSSKQEHARISATAAFTSGADDKPGNLIFYTTADGGSSPTERARIDSLGNIGVNQTSVNSSRKMEITQPASYTSGLRINSAGASGNGAYVEFFVGSANYKVGGNHSTNALLFQKDGTEYMRHDSGGRLLIGTTSSRSTAGTGADLQVETTDAGGRISVVQNRNDATACPFVVIGKSRGTSLGSNTVLQDDDRIGAIVFAGADGTDMGSDAARIIAEVDGTPGGNDMPGRLILSTTSDGSDSATERLRIDSNGNFIFKNGALIENGFHDDGGGMTGDYNHDLGTYGNVHYAATNPAGSYTYNLRINSSTSVNSVMAEGDTLSFTFINNISGNTGRYMTAFKIDGTTQTVEWAGGSAPSENSGSGSDVYSFTIIKTANATFKVFGSFTNHD